MWFPIKRERHERKNDIINHENGKNQYLRQCTKEAMHRVLKLIANLADEYSIGGMINADGIVRREDFG